MGYLPSGRTITAAAQGSKRVDHPPHGPDWSVDCGPFRSASAFESPDEAPQCFCDLGVVFDHPEVEEGARYDVEVSNLTITCDGGHPSSRGSAFLVVHRLSPADLQLVDTDRRLRPRTAPAAV
jgi:hypothetical protein